MVKIPSSRLLCNDAVLSILNAIFYSLINQAVCKCILRFLYLHYLLCLHYLTSDFIPKLDIIKYTGYLNSATIFLNTNPDSKYGASIH
ncbi:protein of unknown function [Cardinium endosymbiont cEper1 of Encarsia pergandiella]|nr:protein of unknown function [Cardinium endosymbiont cEper1 of Encarsia pergandiella]